MGVKLRRAGRSVVSDFVAWLYSSEAEGESVLAGQPVRGLGRGCGLSGWGRR